MLNARNQPFLWYVMVIQIITYGYALYMNKLDPFLLLFATPVRYIWYYGFILCAVLLLVTSIFYRHMWAKVMGRISGLVLGLLTTAVNILVISILRFGPFGAMPRAEVIIVEISLVLFSTACFLHAYYIGRDLKNSISLQRLVMKGSER